MSRLGPFLSVIYAVSLCTAGADGLVSYHGRLAVAGEVFDGTGKFKFALVDATGTMTHWSNDGTSVAGGEPTAAVALPVTKGLYDVHLGDTSLTNMMAVDLAVFDLEPIYLRGWFDDGVNGTQLLTPDHLISKVPQPIVTADATITADKLDPNLASDILPGSQLIMTPLGNESELVKEGCKKIGELTFSQTEGWQPTSLVGAPTARGSHSAIWTGSECIIWGGWNGGATNNTGAIYDPKTNSWRPMSTVGAPAPRFYHASVWTGTHMFVWGGVQSGGGHPLDGGLYNPQTDTWTPISTEGAPVNRQRMTAVWTGKQVIVWGGQDHPNYYDSGGCYSPDTDSWQPTSRTNAPSGRFLHRAVWTGSEMIVWGGRESPIGALLNTGGRYDPAHNAWKTTPLAGAPSPRQMPAVVWSGTEMIIWGGFGGGTSGGRYDPVEDSWVATSMVNSAPPSSTPSFVWTGIEMIVWGGGHSEQIDTGGRYNPAIDSWSQMPLHGAPSARESHSALWTGNEMIVFGGMSNVTSHVNTGGRYLPPEKLIELYQK